MTSPINFGDKQYDYGAGYPAPFSIPDDTVCRVFKIPANEDNAEWLAVFMGALYALTFPEAWQQFEGAITKDQAAERWADMLNQAYDDAPNGCQLDVPTPYWDEDVDVDDEESAEEQVWYGSVEDPEADPGELTFVEDATIWAFTGFVAFATIEIGAVAPALFFRTIARRWVLAFKRGDLGAAIRVIVDGAEYGRVDTTDADPGDVVEINVIAPEEAETHDMYLVQVEP